MLTVTVQIYSTPLLSDIDIRENKTRDMMDKLVA